VICQACGVEAPTKYVSFHQNIGALVVRFSKSVEGRLCKSCIHKHFWSLTGTTFFLGWWGAISFLVTPFFLLNNVVRYTTCLGMPPVPEGAEPPVLTDEAVERIRPHAQRLFDELNAGGKLEDVANEIAELSGASPAQVVLFVRAVVQAQQQE
jgi:hypothetical protein